MYKNVISAVYKITNTVTKGFYIGSSKNVMNRWLSHKCPSFWKKQPNNPLYKDMQKYGVDKFRFQILAPVTPECLNQVEQELIEMLHPTYNKINANGLDDKRLKKSRRKWRQSDKGKESHRKSERKYQNQSCSYNGEILTLGALSWRFYRAGVEHPTLKAKKYLIKEKE